MNAERYCAYNQTRQRFVATKIEAADGAAAGADARLLALEPGDETALLISPFSNLSPSSARFPLDLVYLDSNFVVLDTVEFFPMNLGGAASAKATSVLVLAADTLAQAQVRCGDQLVISEPTEITQYLQRQQNGAHTPEVAEPDVEAAAAVVVANATASAGQLNREAAEEFPVAEAGTATADRIDETPIEAVEEHHQLAAVQARLPFEEAAEAARDDRTAVVAATVGAAELAGRNMPVLVPIKRSNGTPARKTAEPPEKLGPVMVPRVREDDTPAEFAALLNAKAAPAVAPIDRNNGTPAKITPEKKGPVVVPSDRGKDVPAEGGAELNGKRAPAVTRSDGDDSATAKPIDKNPAENKPVTAPGVRGKSTAKQLETEAPVGKELAPAPPAPSDPDASGPAEIEAEPPRKEEPANVPAVVPIDRSNGRQRKMAPLLPGEREGAAAAEKGERQWKRAEAQKGWFGRLLSEPDHDPRRSPREHLPGMVAYFFTGGIPTHYPVKDISLLGLYIVTKVRWYHGTIVQLTLTDDQEATAERSITLFGKVVRLGMDGVGMKFVLEGDQSRRHTIYDKYAPTNGVDVVRVARFMHNFMFATRHAE